MRCAVDEKQTDSVMQNIVPVKCMPFFFEVLVVLGDVTRVLRLRKAYDLTTR